MEDPHVRAVVDLLPAAGTVVLDAASLPRRVIEVRPSSATLLDRGGRPVSLRGRRSARGWIRRFAPAGWDDHVELGSHRAAVLSARLGLLGAILRDPAVEWLTPVDRLVPAEGKLVQYRAAEHIGLRTPPTIVTADAQVAADRLGEPFIAKPLGPGNFQDSEQRQHAVFVKGVTAQDLAGVDLLDAPFLFQRLLVAQRHLRIVTVAAKAWVTTLDAEDLPCDWRRHEPAHDGFETVPEHHDTEVRADAVRLAMELQVGFSSQDWVVDSQGACFLDLNPGGQWRFLPTGTTDDVAMAIARWLEEGETPGVG